MPGKKLFYPLYNSLLLLLTITSVGTAQNIQRPDLIGIASIEVQVSDLKKATGFYQDLLGYSTTPLTINEQQALLIHLNQRQSIIVHGGLPEGQIERLIAVSFQTTDVKAMQAYLKSKGVSVPDILTRDKNNNLSFAIHDPEKHGIKFIQYAAANQQQPASKAGAPISTRILHAGITVSNLPIIDAFYKDILGFSEIWRGGANDSITSWINMRLPESTDYIEYMLVTTPPNKQQLGSLHHIALLVPDMQQAIDILRPRAAKTGYNMAAPRIGRNNKWQLNLYDPDGTRVELMEPFTFR
jgi:catechol 2,3-dioxygenase-like lactoylglutathione lyase family enzyme